MTFRNDLPETQTVARPTHFWRLTGIAFSLPRLFCFSHVGNWLVVEDPLDHAQAIAILSGRMPVRALEAAKLYNAGYAPEVWLTHSSEPGKSLKEMGVESYGEEFYNAKILVHQGVPPTPFVCSNHPLSIPRMKS